MIRRLLAVTAGLLLVPTAADAAPRCTAGTTVHREADARLFFVEREETIYGCRKGSRRAVALTTFSETYSSFDVLRRSGTVLPFTEETSGEGGGSDATIGWFDLRTGRRGLARAFMSSAGPDVLEAVVARDGTTAVVSRDADAGAVVVSLHPVDAKRRLRPGRGRAFVTGRYRPRSLRLGGGTISWLDDRGARAVPVAGEPGDCRAGRTRVEVGATRVFEAFDLRRNTGVLRWCGAGQGPVGLPTKPSPFQVLERPHISPAREGRIAFAGAGVAGIADGAAGVRSLKTPRDVVATGVGRSGQLVAAYDRPGGELEGGVLVAAPAAAPGAFAAPQLIATTREAFEPRSFGVAGDVVSWRSREGARSVPLGGETDVSCAAGTTLGRRDGARVFEVLDVPGGKRTLFACPAGTTPAFPFALLTQPLPRPFPVFFFGVREGRGVVVRGGERRSDLDTIITFATSADSVRRGQTHSGSTRFGIDDVAVAPDGAVAYVVDHAETVEAYVLAATPTGLAPAQKVGQRDGGLRRNSLAVTATEVSWQTRKGTTVRVRRP